MIEGTYEKRESANLDPNNSTQYGVSARLLQDGGSVRGSFSNNSPATTVLSLSPPSHGQPHNGGGGAAVDENPYEKLGRCNSFTPKTRAEKARELEEKQTQQQLIDDNQENKDSVYEKIPDKSKVTLGNETDNTASSITDQVDCGPDTEDTKEDNDIQLDLGMDDNSKSSPNSDHAASNDKQHSPVTESVDHLPFVGKNTKPMEMSSFKPGSSMRKKQQRTSMKKPNKSASLKKGDPPPPSETHEEVTITPVPMKKHFKVLDSTPPDSDNASTVSHTPNGGGSAFSSCERIPAADELETGDVSAQTPTKSTDSSIGKSNESKASGDNEIIKPSNSDHADIMPAKNDNNIDDVKSSGAKDGTDSSTDNDYLESAKDNKPIYADIEIMKDNNKDNMTGQNGSGNGIYTDVIIADD